MQIKGNTLKTCNQFCHFSQQKHKEASRLLFEEHWKPLKTMYVNFWNTNKPIETSWKRSISSDIMPKIHNPIVVKHWQLHNPFVLKDYNFNDMICTY
jgi:hypothetical protein